MVGTSQGNVIPLRASDVAYEQLREMILDLRLSAGEILNEHSLAATLGIGRMPVREAIGRLVSDRFIVVLPRRGTAVAPMAMEDVVHLFEAREAVECGIAYVAARKVTPVQVEEFRGLVEEAEAARGVFDAERFLLDDLRIHRFLVEQMDNALLQDAAERLLLHNLRFWRSFFRTRLPHADTMLSHRDLLLALEDGDCEGAQSAMRAHIGASRQLLQALF